MTTRDWLQQRQNVLERVIDRTKNWLIRHILGPIAYSASSQAVKEILSNVGFEVAFFPVKVPIFEIRIPMMNYIIIYKPSKKESHEC